MKHNKEQIHETSKKIPLLVGDEAEEDTPILETNETAKELHDEDSEDIDNSKLEQSYDVSGPAWQGYIFAALPILACLFGAGRETWSKGIITIPLALVLICFASKRRLPLIATIGLVGAMFAPLLSFLPAAWLSQTPGGWRSVLVTDWGAELSKTLTPQAAVTFEAWLFFSMCCTWLGWCLTRGFSDHQRRAIIYTLTFGGILLCLLSILEGSKWISIPWWPRKFEWGEGFGPFANRNHISSIAAMTCVLCAASGYDSQRRKTHLWILFVLGIIVPIICIFMNSSRAGLIMLFVGMTTWFGTIAMRRGFFQKLAVSSSLIFIIATLLVMSGGNISKRFSDASIAEFTIDQGRVTIYGECLKMALNSPWIGIGLGNFDAVFPQFSAPLRPMYRSIHPESDLLWLLAEGGLLTIFPSTLLLIWMFISTGPWFGKKKQHRTGMHDRRLRNAAAIVFGLGAIHGFGDVPNHGLGYALFMALLVGVAIRPRRLPLPAAASQRLVFRLGGLAALALGIAWTAIAMGHAVMPSASAAESLRDRAVKLVDSGSPSGALILMDQAIAMKPMDFRYYFERARIRLMLGQPANDALTDFSRSRMLEPHYALYCYLEGVYWLDFDPKYSVIGWRELLRRYPASASGGHGYFRQMLNYVSRHPELREPLWNLANTAELKLDFLGGVQTTEEFNSCLRSLLAQQPELAGLDAAQRERFFNLWYQHGDQITLISALETNRKWRDDGWRILAEHYARDSDFQRACQTVVPYLPSVIRSAPGTSSDIPALERALLYNPTDARRGIDLFQAQKNQGDIDGALRTLEKVASIPNAPPYIRQEIAALYMMKQDFRRAWEQLREAMQKR